MHRYGRWVGDYVAGQLSPRKVRALERHLQHCDPCSAELAAGSRLDPPAVPQQQLSAQTLLGVHYSVPPDPGAGKSRFHSVVPATVMLLTLALLGTIAGLSWVLGASTAQGTPESDPAESWGTSAHSLDSATISQLRIAGWTCPVIDAAGFGFSSATGVLTKGEATVNLVLSDEKDTVEIAETRMLTAGAKSAIPSAGAANASKDPSSGMLTELGHRLGAKAAAAVTYEDGAATLELEDVRYTITTSLSKSEVEEILQRLVVSEHTRVAAFDATSENYSQRLLRGFSRLMVLDFQ